MVTVLILAPPPSPRKLPRAGADSTIRRRRGVPTYARNKELRRSRTNRPVYAKRSAPSAPASKPAKKPAREARKPAQQQPTAVSCGGVFSHNSSHEALSRPSTQKT